MPFAYEQLSLTTPTRETPPTALPTPTQPTQVSRTFLLRSPSVLSSILRPLPLDTPTNRSDTPHYQIVTVDNTTSVLLVHPSAGWTRTVSTINWAGGGPTPASTPPTTKKSTQDTTVDLLGTTIQAKDALTKPSPLSS